jgi:hypothetical protein
MNIYLYNSIFYKLLMWFWPVDEMIELISGMPTPQSEDESSWMRGSELVQNSSSSCVSFWLLYEVFTNPPEVHVHQFENHWPILHYILIAGISIDVSLYIDPYKSI